MLNAEVVGFGEANWYDLDHDLEVKNDVIWRSKQFFLTTTPHFWPRKQKNQKILRSYMTFGQGHGQSYGQFLLSYEQDRRWPGHLRQGRITYQ